MATGGALDDRCGEIVRLHFFENLAYAEIAARVGRAEVTMRVYMFDCVRLLEGFCGLRARNAVAPERLAAHGAVSAPGRTSERAGLGDEGWQSDSAEASRRCARIRLCAALLLASVVSTPGSAKGSSGETAFLSSPGSVSRALLIAAPSAAGTTQSAPDTADAVQKLIDAGNYAEAEAEARRLLREAEAGGDTASARVAGILDDLVGALVFAGKSSKAESRLLAERAVRLKESLFPARHEEVAWSLNQLGTLLRRAGDMTGARPLFERALAIREGLFGHEHIAVARSATGLAHVLSDLGQSDSARVLYERALRIREKLLPPDDPDVAAAMVNFANVVLDLGEKSRARELFEGAIRIWEKSLGPDHPYIAGTLGNLGNLLSADGDFAGARPLYERALEINRRRLPKGHPQLGTALDAYASLLSDLGEYDRARELYEQALEIRRAALGEYHVEVGKTVNNLAIVLRAKRDLRRARELYEQALAISEKAYSSDHFEVATNLDNLASVLADQEDFAGAESLYTRALEIRLKSFGPDAVEVSGSLNNLGLLYWEKGDFASADSLLGRAMRIRERLGPDHPLVAQVLNNLANLASELGDYRRAEELQRRALAIKESVYGTRHPDVATSQNNLAAVLKDFGRYGEAMELYERALSIRVEKLGPAHELVAGTQVNIGNVLMNLGDYSAARAAYDRARAIQESSGSGKESDLAGTLNCIAVLLNRSGDLEGSKRYHERAVGLFERALGPGHLRVAVSLNNLAGTLIDLGEADSAGRHLERAMAIIRTAVGEGHPLAAGVLGNEGARLAFAGDLTAARQRHEHALAILEKALGPAHPDLVTVLNNLADVSARSKAPGPALDLAIRGESISREHLRLVSRTLSERQALAYAAARTDIFDLAISLAGGAGEGAVEKAWDALIRSRALVLDEMALRHRVVVGSGDTAVARLHRHVASQRERLANLTVRGPGAGDPERYRRALEAAREEKERTERTLAERSAAFREELTRSRAGLAEVRAAIPRSVALVAYAAWRGEAGEAGPRHRGSHDTAPAGADTGDVPRRDGGYVAFFLRGASGEVGVLPLGATETIDSLVARWRAEAGRETAGPAWRGDEIRCRNAGEKLRRAVWDPIAARIEGATQVFVIPDGALHLVNFAAFPAGDGRYLVETIPQIHYLSAERDLIASEDSSSAGVGLLAVGGPDFDDRSALAGPSPAERSHDSVPPLVSSAADSSPAGSTSSQAASSAIAVAARYRGPRSGCGDFRSLRFGPLPEAAREAGAIAHLWQRAGRDPSGSALQLRGAAANEGAFKQRAAGHRVLHLATHGFFLGGRCPSILQTSGAARPPRAAESPPPATTTENPLLLSGLALAGANRRDASGPEEEDGILTAEEIASLDLRGTEWAVLSACNTGVGEVRAGEGVLGLRRAFQVAGARTTIMSLWSVEDRAARRWMQALYDGRLRQGLGTAEAVREASLRELQARRARGQSTHPFYWAGFVAAGDWR